jgi:hypothetical protein
MRILSVAVGTLAIAVAGTALVGAARGLDYDITYAGTFHVTPFSAPDLHWELSFDGHGEGAPLGHTAIHGSSHMAPGADGCSPILEDAVTLSAEGGTLLMVNSGTDCLDVLSEPGHVLIVGTGTTEFVGGTGLYAGASGGGAWTVRAEIEEPWVGIPPGVQGHFGPLRFTGSLALP